MSTNPIGHNSQSVLVRTKLKLFNSITRYAGKEGRERELSLPAGSSIDDVIKLLGIPKQELFLVFVNGRDITPKTLPKLGQVRTGYILEEGDVIAFSGPVPYSWGYGSPIV